MYNVPDVLKYTNAAVFFNDFIELNRPEISYRSFAESIQWPISLLNDIIHKRRALAVSRAVEFSHYFNMTGFEGERLVMLAIKDAERPELSVFVDTYLSGGQQWPEPKAASPSDVVGAPDDVAFYPPELMADQALGSLFMFLVWCQGRTTEAEIGSLLYLSPELRNSELLNEKLEILRSLGFIVGHLPEVKILRPNVGTSGMSRAQFFEGLEALRPLVTSEKKYLHWRMSRLVFPRALYLELHQRINALVNWMQNRCKDERSKDQDRDEYVVLQTNFLVTHLLDLEKLGLAIQPGPDSRHVLVKETQSENGF